DLYAPPLLNDRCEVALIDFARLCEGHGRVGANLDLDSLSLTPLLHHPIRNNALCHRPDRNHQAARAPTAAVSTGLLFLLRLYTAYRVSDAGICQAGHERFSFLAAGFGREN